MKASWQIARVAGISIRIHATFPVLLLWIAMVSYERHRQWDKVGASLLFVLTLFLIVVLHELGHALVARRFGIGTRDITLLPIGGVARLERMPGAPRQEMLVAVAGPLVNVALAIPLFAALWLRSSPTDFSAVALVEGDLLARLAWVNVSLALFNMLPAFPMDGGRVLRALLAMRLDYVRATGIAARVGQGLAVVLGFVGLVSNPFLSLMAVFIWMGAGEEAAATRLRSTLAGLPLERVMLTEFHTLHPTEPLARAVDHAVAIGQHDFLVVDHGRVVGILRHADLLSGLARAGLGSPVDGAMCRDFHTASPTDDVDSVLGLLTETENGGRAMPVMQDGNLVGLFTCEGLGEFLALQNSLRRLPAAGLRRNRTISAR